MKHVAAKFGSDLFARQKLSDYHDLLPETDPQCGDDLPAEFPALPASLAALETGTNVFCEKPPTLNSAEMKVLHEEAAKRWCAIRFSMWEMPPSRSSASRMGGRATRDLLGRESAGRHFDGQYFGRELNNSTVYGTK